MAIGEKLKTIIEENKYKIQTIIKYMTGNQNEDIEQEIYIKIWKNLEKYQAGTNFGAWIKTLASNVCKDFLKSKAHKIETLKSDDEHALDTIKDKNNPQKILDSKMRQKIILKAVDSLPKKMKEVVYLYEFEEKSYTEISKKLNIPEGTVKSRLNNARKILANVLEKIL